MGLEAGLLPAAGRWARQWAWRLRGVPKMGARPDALAFGPPRADGIVAVGGSLSAERLVAAYRLGLFPWSGPHEPVLWRSPDPRHVIDLSLPLRFPRDVPRLIRQERWAITCDRAFGEVIRAAAAPREGSGSWLGPEVIAAYLRLHERGQAHSLEAWSGGALVAGLYGVALGRIWFGESMFTRAKNAGSVLLGVLNTRLQQWGFLLSDGQFPSAHLARFGQEPWPRERFLAALAEGVRTPDWKGPWDLQARSPFEQHPPTIQGGAS